jgi:D,D-heptose 1,7-bisphosphate phosphatase
MLHHAVFLDRDGTINFDPGYIKNPDDLKILPGVIDGIRKLKEQFGFKIVVVSNQAGVAKGLMTITDVEAVNSRLIDLLKDGNAILDAVYYCPFHPDHNTPEESKCRKPSPEMILKAASDLSIDTNRSYMVGDRASDVECGLNAGVKSILLNSDITELEISALHNKNKKPNFVAANFIEACDFIIKDFGGSN